MAHTRTFPPSFLYGTYADRPSTSLVTGQLYLVTDIDPNRIYMWTGSAWMEVARGWSETAGPDYADRYGLFVLMVADATLPHHRVLTEGAGIDIADGGAEGDVTVSVSGNKILLYSGGGAVVAEYTATSAGLDLASAAAAAGDVVWMPARSISGDHSLTAGVRYIGVSRWASVLTGQITLGVNTTLEICSVTRTANSASVLTGVIGPSSGTARVRDCDVTCVQSGGGNAFAVSVEDSGDVEVWGSYLYGSSGSGAGYGGYHKIGESGDLYAYMCRVVGSTGAFNE